jgi:site-specific DNA-methyltransferase (adenine-specific)
MMRLEDYLYYEEENPSLKIYHGKCEEILPLIGKVNLVITDPPYNAENIGSDKKVYCEGKMKLSIPEYKKFCKTWFDKCRAEKMVFTPGIANVCYYDQPDWIFCWHKPAACSFNRMGGYNAWEPIMIYGKPAKGKRFGQDYIKVNTLNFTKGIEKNHPCPKVFNLWRYLVDGFAEGLVLDPFLGSGTTLAACKELGFDGIGIEKSKEYCEISKLRIQQTMKSLF